MSRNNFLHHLGWPDFSTDETGNERKQAKHGGRRLRNSITHHAVEPYVANRQTFLNIFGRVGKSNSECDFVYVAVGLAPGS